MLRSLSKMGLHVTFVLALAGLWNLIHHPSFASLTQFLPCLLGYALSLLMESGILRISTEDEFLFCEALSVFMHLCFVLGVVDESDLATFVITGQLATGGTFFLAVTFMDLQVLLPLYACEATVLTWKLWRLIGFENLTPMLVCATVVSHLLLSSTFAFMVSSMRSKIAARQDSHDATSMLHGFRQVLRSVCDGGLVLDRQNCQIVDGANCLERLLASNKSLANTNFLDLFLDAEARQRFLQFLSEDAKGAECEDARTHSNPAMPLGLRVSLQGARGPVSLDLFCTSGSISGPTGNDLCLLAIKEDAEQIAPDAPPDSVPPMSSMRQGLRFPSTRSTLSELVEAYDELTQVALLVSNNTGFMDIEEAHLSFKRQSPALTIEPCQPFAGSFDLLTGTGLKACLPLWRIFQPTSDNAATFGSPCCFGFLASPGVICARRKPVLAELKTRERHRERCISGCISLTLIRLKSCGLENKNFQAFTKRHDEVKRS